jgi:hypothetical protein
MFVLVGDRHGHDNDTAGAGDICYLPPVIISIRVKSSVYVMGFMPINLHDNRKCIARLPCA